MKFRNIALALHGAVRWLFRGTLERYYKATNYPGPEYKSIPIIINNFNRLDCLKALIGRLENLGYRNLIILDNKSSFPPLLEYYATIPYRVIRLKKNYGYSSFWKSGVFLKYFHHYHVYTDPDVVPIDECPDDFMQHFLNILYRHDVEKVGFGLKIDDLPDHFEKKQEVISWESKWWENEIEPGIFNAQVDTTFALYRPLAVGAWYAKAFRTGYPYLARHLPWYSDTSAPTEEEIYYMKTMSTGASFWYKKK